MDPYDRGMQVERVRSVDELTHAVKGLRAEKHWKWWYRGHADSGWALLPFIRRGFSARQERYLTNEFRPRAAMRYPHPPRDDDYAGWLALMQHYGLPTRLLD